MSSDVPVLSFFCCESRVYLVFAKHKGWSRAPPPESVARARHTLTLDSGSTPVRADCSPLRIRDSVHIHDTEYSVQLQAPRPAQAVRVALFLKSAQRKFALFHICID